MRPISQKCSALSRSTLADRSGMVVLDNATDYRGIEPLPSGAGKSFGT
jgi:hypothetical protein